MKIRFQKEILKMTKQESKLLNEFINFESKTKYLINILLLRKLWVLGYKINISE